MRRMLPVCLVMVLASIPPRAGAPAPPAAGDLGARLDRFLTESGFEGVALVAKGGTVLLQKGYGLADREQGVPNAPDTVVSVGSITKQFTAAAILKLEMERKLAVADPIAKFWKDAPEDKRAITIHQLLTHTAGLDSDFAGDYDPVGRDEYVARVLGSKLRTKPGTEYFYANSGYSLLAALVEIVSGQPYETYLRERLLLPAQARETGYRAPKWDPKRVPVGYREGKRWGTMLEQPWAADGPYWALRGNGGIESTLSDLWAWSRALDGDAVLAAPQREKMFAPHVSEGPGTESWYGYGWAIFKTPWNTKLVAHNGGNGIFSADFRRYVDDGIVVITGASDSATRAWRYSDGLARIARGEEVAPERPQAKSLTALGDGPRHQLVRRWVEVFNTQEIEGVRAFRAEHMVSRTGGPSEEQRDETTRRMWSDLGSLTIEGVVAEDPETVTVRMKTASGPPARLHFSFSPENKIAGLRIEVGD